MGRLADDAIPGSKPDWVGANLVGGRLGRQQAPPAPVPDGGVLSRICNGVSESPQSQRQILSEARPRLGERKRNGESACSLIEPHMAGCGGYYYSHRLGAATSPLAPQSSNNPSSNGFQTSIPLSATPQAASYGQQENPRNPHRAAGQFPWLPAPSPEQNNGVPAYRRHLAAAPEPCAKVRAEGRKIVASPRRAPAPPGGIKMFPAARAHEAGHLPEPDVGHMGRGEARASNAPSAKERSLEQSLHRKVRVNPGSYQGSGRAGDLSAIHKPPADYLEGFHPRKADAPGFRRFMDSLAPPPQVGPHQHRIQEAAAAAADQTATAAQGIQQLEAWDTQHINTAAEEEERTRDRAALLAQARRTAAANAAVAAKASSAASRAPAAGKPTKR